MLTPASEFVHLFRCGGVQASFLALVRRAFPLTVPPVCLFPPIRPACSASVPSRWCLSGDDKPRQHDGLEVIHEARVGGKGMLIGLPEEGRPDELFRCSPAELQPEHPAFLGTSAPGRSAGHARVTRIIANAG